MRLQKPSYPPQKGQNQAQKMQESKNTSQLSTISGQLVSLQEAVVMSTPESAEDPNIWDKPFNDYSPLEGYALLTFVIILAACGLSIFRRF